jgi:hypothetical protein
MAGAPQPAQAGDAQGDRVTAWGRSDSALFTVAATTVAAIAVQFALAGFGAFTMDKTPSDNAYGAHAALGIAIAVLTVLILAAVLASRAARAHPTTLRLAVVLVVLALAVQPILGGTGQNVPALGALHGLNGLVIFGLTGWLTGETARRRAAARS